MNIEDRGDFSEYDDLEDQDQFFQGGIDPIRQQVIDLLPPKIVNDQSFQHTIEELISLHSSPVEPGEYQSAWDIAQEIVDYYQNSR